MSASDAEFHLDPFDTAKQTRQKIARSFCEPCNVNGNVSLQLAKLFIFPLTSTGERMIIFVMFFYRMGVGFDDFIVAFICLTEWFYDARCLRNFRGYSMDISH